MKTNPLFAVLIALVLFAVAYGFQSRNAIAQAPVVAIEQYRVLNAAGQNDAQIEARLNALATEGWRVRCSTPTGLVLAR
jgi:hypothetical protein